VVATLFTLFYKVSIHTLGVTGILGILLPLNKVAENNSLFIPTLVLIVIAGLVMSARLQLNSHTPREVLIGAVTGFAVGFFGMIILF
jgi:membrane-associated phospholipid phosphatase